MKQGWFGFICFATLVVVLLLLIGFKILQVSFESGNLRGNPAEVRGQTDNA